MKKIATTLLFSLLALSVLAEEKITLGNSVFTLVFEHQEDEHRLYEFTTESETIEAWTKLVAVREYPKLSEPYAYIMNMAKEYKKQYPHMHFAAGFTEDKKDCWVDYIAYPRGRWTSKDKKYVEWNYFRAVESADGGLLVLQYAERAKYKKKREEAYTKLDIKNLRNEMMPILEKTKIEPVAAGQRR